jgi:homoserine O-acetyltransferase
MCESGKQSLGIVQTQSLRVVDTDHPLVLSCGRSLAPIDVAYETYGRLNDRRDNAVLLCHALSGDAHAAGTHAADDKKPGWWDTMIGPGKSIDTDKYYVICSNFLGGCAGTTGPASINPDTGHAYGLDFPIITIADMVEVQKRLLDRLKIPQLLAVIGGSLGGMQVLQWLLAYPDFVRAGIPIATTTHLGAQSIAFDAVGRNAILGDPGFAEGQYQDRDGPTRGLAIARMIGHITYLSEEGMRRKFGRALRSASDYTYDFNSEFSVETYLDYQGQSFVERFDANSYLYITKAADYFDLEKEYGSLTAAFEKVRARMLCISFSSDWLFTPTQAREIVDAMVVNHKDVSYCDIASAYGHDAFLLEVERLGRLVGCFLEATFHPEMVEAGGSCCEVEQRDLTHYDRAHRLRVDYALIESLIEPGARVLDVGCGDGELLARLRADKQVKAKGIELEEDQILSCVCKGIAILHHDIELGLEQYPDRSFDYVILSQTVQTVRNPRHVINELLRVGKKVIVSFPNFAYWQSRFQLFFRGRAPVTKKLPFGWYNSPNIHFLSLKDFDRFCVKSNITIEKRIALSKQKASPVRWWPNLLAEQVIYVTSRK